MDAEILSVGTELLLGQIVNTDSQFISRELSSIGINVFYHTTVGDNPFRLKDCLNIALERSDIVITTGGLGPTMDDLTKETIAEYLGLDLLVHQDSADKIKRFFLSIGREMTENNLKQALFPLGAIILENTKGTAPGCIIETENGKIIIVLPGPPFELMPMFLYGVKPYLAQKSEYIIHSKVLRIFGIGESKAETMIKDLLAAQSNPTIAPYAGFGEVTLRLTARCGKNENPMKWIEPIEREIRKRFGDTIYGTDQDSLESVVARLLFTSNKKIALAESCTGGLVTQTLTNVPGISQSLIEGVVTYSNEAKIRRLNVSAQTLEKYGAVSMNTAREMAIGLLEQTDADIALSITGIAGPDGGSEAKPVGLVYIGLATRDTVEVHELHLTGDRERIKKLSCLNALDLLRLNLSR